MELQGEIEKANRMFHEKGAKVVKLEQEGSDLKAKVLDLQAKLESNEKVMVHRDVEIVDLFKSRDSNQSWVAFLIVEMEHINGTTQKLMGVNVDLKLEVEAMKKPTGEVVAEAHKRIDEIVISQIYVC